MKKSRITQFFCIFLIISMLFTQIVPASGLLNENPDQKEEEFIQPSKIEADTDNEYKKDPLLRLPETSGAAEEEETQGELISIGEYTKFYKTGEDTYKTVYTSIPNTYKDALGKQHEIDNTLEKKSSLLNGTYFTNKANALNVVLPAEISGEKGIQIVKDGVSVKLIPMDGDYTNTAVKDNAILYNNVYDGVDVQYTVTELAVKEDIILNKFVDNNSFRYCIEAEDVELRLEEGVINVYKWNEAEPVMSLSAPVMSDAAGNLSENITLSMEKSLGSTVITITADSEWLSDPSRAFPVKIDPSVTVGSQNITMVTTSLHKGTNQGKSYGYAGYVSDDNIGMPGTGDFGRTRMYMQIDSDLGSIPEKAEIQSASLVMYQYGNYNHGSTKFYSYALKTPWSPGTLDWAASVNISREPSGSVVIDENTSAVLASPESISHNGFHYFNITETVNNWKKGILPNYGLMIKTEPEDDSVIGGAFYTPYSSGGNDGQGGFTPDKAPRLEIEWKIPGDVPDRDINDVTVELAPISESSLEGKLNFNGIFIHGMAKPNSQVTYSLNDTGKNFAGTAEGDIWFKYPDSSNFESYFPSSNKYRLKKSNWQSGIPFTNFDFNTLYYFSAFASLGGDTGAVKNSETFTAYKIKQFDTLPNIANYYGVNLASMMYDNRVQDILLIENNTLFIRNPQRNATVPYNPAPLSDAEKRKIDGALMGRGLHCEFGFEPININTGNFYLNAEDVSIPDYNGDFTITRSYNGKGASYNSMFGRGWNFEYEERLSLMGDGSILYCRGDGSTVYFTPDGAGNYVSPAGVYLNLSKIAASTKTMDFGNGEEETRVIYEYEIRDTNNYVRRFDAYGMLNKSFFPGTAYWYM